MRELICEFCSTRQPYDPRPGAKCLNCGGPVKAPRRCFACHAFVPPNPACIRCKAPTVDLELYAAAVMLAAKGTATGKVAGRLTHLELGEREALEKEYRNSWMPVDDALETIVALMAARTGPKFVDMSREQFEQMRKSMEPAALLPVIRAGIKTWKDQKPSIAPWPHGFSKAICEAAPLKLDRLRYRLDHPRGYDAKERADIKETAGHLEPTMGPAALGTSYLNTLAYRHSLVLGEVVGSHETQPVFDLHEASQGREPLDMAIPVTLLRDRGVMWAYGSRPSHDATVPWVPDGYVYAPFNGAPIALADLDGLRAFLKAMPIPIEPVTLSQIVHWLLAPFPWEARVAMDEDLVHEFLNLEIEEINRLHEHEGAARKLGASRTPRTARRDVLEVRIGETTLVYRPPELEVRGPAPKAMAIPAFRATSAPLPEHAPAEKELVCGNCGVRREFDGKNCGNCGAAADAGTKCFSCFEEIPPTSRCPHCGVPTLAMRFHAVALMLRSNGVDFGDIPAKAKAMTPPEQLELEAWYTKTWKPVDDAIEGLRTTLKRHYEPEILEHMMETVRLSRWTPGATPETVTVFVRQIAATAKAPASIAPWPPEICKAVHEAAPVKLMRLAGRRGLDADERRDVAKIGREHGADADYAIGAAYLNELSYRHCFVWGEIHDRNETKPVFELAEAAKGVDGIPVCLVRGKGVIVAQGPAPTADVTKAWHPTGFAFVAGKRTLLLHELDGLRAFLKELKPPILPATLPYLVHVLLMPFPWTAAFEEPTGLIEKWRDGAQPSMLKRLFGGGGAKELVLKVAKKTVTYREGDVQIG